MGRQRSDSKGFRCRPVWLSGQATSSSGGGRLLLAGTPEELVVCPDSHTGRHLKPLLSLR